MTDKINPYAPPPHTETYERRSPLLNRLRSPSIGLLVLSLLSLVAGIFCLLQLIAIVSATLYNGWISPFTGIIIPLSRQGDWWIGLIGTVSGAANIVVFRGARCMRNGRKYRLAMIAAILSCIPGLSPAICFGIPFGIWALIVLRRPSVRAAFRS